MFLRLFLLGLFVQIFLGRLPERVHTHAHTQVPGGGVGCACVRMCLCVCCGVGGRERYVATRLPIFEKRTERAPSHPAVRRPPVALQPHLPGPHTNPGPLPGTGQRPRSCVLASKVTGLCESIWTLIKQAKGK